MIKDEEFEEVRRDLEHFDDKSNPNMSEIKTINQEIMKISKRLRQAYMLNNKREI